MLFRLFVALHFWLALGSALAAPVVCTDLLTANLGHDYALEQQILTSVVPEAIETSSVRRLSKGVYLLSVKDGNQVVLRFQADAGPPTFELLASRFIQAAPGGNTPSIRVLSPQELQSFVPVLRQLGVEVKTNSGATLAVYFAKPLELGRFYLENQVGTRLRDELAEFANNVRQSTRLAKSEALRKRLHDLWSEATPAARDTVIKDLRKHFPELKDAPDDALLVAFMERSATFNSSRLDGFRDAAWEHLPAEIKTQLADHWALFTVLGIPDFHFSNWLVHSGKVVAIDAADRTSFFSRGDRSIEFPGQQSPIDGGSISASFRAKLVKTISQPLMNHLKALTKKGLDRMAKESNYPLTTLEARGVLGRIKSLKPY